MSYELTSEPIFQASEAENRRAGHRSKSGLGMIPIILLLVFSAVMVVDRVALPHVPVNVDPAFYAVVSHELLLGKSLYTDMWDHKPPAIFVVYATAEMLFGYSPRTLIILNIFVSLIILLGVYYAGRAAPGGAASGLAAAALWGVVSGTFQLEGRDPNTEPFINACIIWAFALLAHSGKTPLKSKTAVLTGLLFLLATLFKPVVIAIAICLAVAHICFSAKKKEAIRGVFIIGAVGAAGWMALLAYFAATDRLPIFYESIFSYNRYYAGDIVANMIEPLRGGSEFFLDFMNPLVVGCVAGLVLVFIKNRRLAALLAAYLGASWIAIALPGRFSVHYYQLWLPPLAVGAAWAVSHFAFSDDRRLRVASVASAAALIAMLIFNQSSQYGSVTSYNWTPAMPLLNASDDTARRIDTLLAADETFFLWGNTPNLYLLTGRRPPASVLFDAHLLPNPVFDQLAERVRSDLARERPPLLVVETRRTPLPDFITQDYEPTPIYHDPDSYSFYARRGSRLAGGK